MKPPYRIAELESWVRGVEEAMISATDRAAEAERERDEYKHRCKVSDGACAIAEQQRDHWMQRAKVAEAEIARREAAASEPLGYVDARVIDSEDGNGGMWVKRQSRQENSYSVPIYKVPPASIVPDGWKLVPTQPTQRMIDAHTEGMANGGATRAYREMLAAAPVPGGDVE